MTARSFRRATCANDAATAASGSVTLNVGPGLSLLSVGRAKVFSQKANRYDPDDPTTGQVVDITAVSATGVTMTLGQAGTSARAVNPGDFILMDDAGTGPDIIVDGGLYALTYAGIRAAGAAASAVGGGHVLVEGGHGLILHDGAGVIPFYDDVFYEIQQGTSLALPANATAYTIMGWTPAAAPAGTGATLGTLDLKHYLRSALNAGQAAVAGLVVEDYVILYDPNNPFQFEINRIKNFDTAADTPEWYNPLAWDYAAYVDPTHGTKLFRIPAASLIKRGGFKGRLDANGNTGTSFGINAYYFADSSFEVDAEGFKTANGTGVLLQSCYNCHFYLNDKNSGSPGYAAHDLEGICNSVIHYSRGEPAGFGLLLKGSVRTHVENAFHHHASGAAARMVKFYHCSDVTFNVIEGSNASTAGSTGVMIGGKSRDIEGDTVRGFNNSAQGLLTSAEGLDGLVIGRVNLDSNNLGGGASEMYLAAADKNITLRDAKFPTNQAGAGNVSIHVNRAPVVTTTDATVTTLVAIGHAGAAVLTATIFARQTNGIEESAGYIISGVFNTAGTLIGALVKDVLGEDVAGWDATLDSAGGALRVRVTGAVGDTVAWSCTYDYNQVLAA